MQVEAPQHLPLTLPRDAPPGPVMSSIARRKPIAFPAASALDLTSESPMSISAVRYPTNKPPISHPAPLLVVAKPTSLNVSTPSATVAKPIYVTVPPHKDWLNMKPLPRPPLPLYHPDRVFKKTTPPRSTSTALPLPRLNGTSPAPDANPNANGQRTSGRSRRAPYKVREGGTSGITSPDSSQEEKDGAGLLEPPAPVKTRRPRRKKAEILAAAAAAAAEQESTLATRRKRRRGADDPAANDEDSAPADVADPSGEPSPKKRRRRTKAEMGEAHRQQQETAIVSNYGTRSRAVRRSASTTDENVSVDGDDAGNETLDASTEQGRSTPVPGTSRKRGRRASLAETTEEIAEETKATDIEAIVEGEPAAQENVEE
jgi:hypothetical protein